MPKKNEIFTFPILPDKKQKEIIDSTLKLVDYFNTNELYLQYRDEVLSGKLMCSFVEYFRERQNTLFDMNLIISDVVKVYLNNRFRDRKVETDPSRYAKYVKATKFYFSVQYINAFNDNSEIKISKLGWVKYDFSNESFNELKSKYTVASIEVSKVSSISYMCGVRFSSKSLGDNQLKVRKRSKNERLKLNRLKSISCLEQSKMISQETKKNNPLDFTQEEREKGLQEFLNIKKEMVAHKSIEEMKKDIEWRIDYWTDEKLRLIRTYGIVWDYSLEKWRLGAIKELEEPKGQIKDKTFKNIHF